MKKLLGIVVLGLLLSNFAYSDSEIPPIKVKAFECVKNKKTPRIYRRYIFFSEDKKTAEQLTYSSESDNGMEREKFDYVQTTLEEIVLHSDYKMMSIDRTNGNIRFLFIGADSVYVGQCKEFKFDIDLENLWKEKANEINEKKKDAIKY